MWKMGVSGFTMEIFSERLHTYSDDDESHVDYVFQNCFPSFFFFLLALYILHKR